MKKIVAYAISIALSIVFYGVLQAASLDGTSNVKYQSDNYVFRDGDYARGIVAFCNGFTVVPGTNHGANLLMDTNISISGSIDLRGTSTMTLLCSLYLDSGVTFSDSGRIYSYGSALVMGGDLTIPAGKVVHCGGNLIIDGGGNTLYLDNSSQLFLDAAATVTLRNMTIYTKHSFPGSPAIALSSNTSRLALDNVMLSLGDDWNINRGQLFIHHDVVVTGTSALVYRSTMPSFIASHGNLMFDNGTTFSYAPATNNKDLIVMSDASSTLALNGCSLKATHTGMRLARGRLYLDDHVQLDSRAVNKLQALSLLTSQDYTNLGGYVSTAAWSPDGRYLAIGGIVPSTFGGDANTNELQIYRFDGNALTTITSQDYGNQIDSLSWSPDGQYVAIGGNAPSMFGGIANTNELQIYRFDGSALTTVISQDYGTRVKSLAWSPDGQYLAIGGVLPSNANELQIYRFDGSALTTVTSQDYGDSGNGIFSVSWSPNGRHLAIGGERPTNGAGGFNDNNELRIYRFNGSTLTLILQAFSGHE